VSQSASKVVLPNPAGACAARCLSRSPITTYGKNGCADAHIDSYLIDLTVPGQATSCT
jgi:hypothetical protein